MRWTLGALIVVQCSALVLTPRAAVPHRRLVPLRQRASGVITCSDDDERAKLIAQRNEALATSVEAMLSEFPKKLVPGSTPPEAIAKLDEALKAKDYVAMYIGLYEVTIEGELAFQLNDDQLLEPLDGSLDWTNTEDETVKTKMSYLYRMGLNMLSGGSPEVQEKIKELVFEKLVKKTGLEGKAFDDWLLL
jgi:hypothetical protein